MLNVPTGISPAPGRRIFYGWFILAAVGMITFSSGPGQSYVFSVFFNSIIEDTGLSRTGISVLFTASTAVSAAVVTLVSRLADRFGPRIVLAGAGLGLGAACFGMATATHTILFFIAFAALRALGQGSLGINCILLVNQWFVSLRGRAVGLMTLGYMSSTALFPPFVRFLIDTIDWRAAYAVLGAVAIGLIVPVATFVIRNRPEDIGLFPDGAPRPPASETRQEDSAADSRVRVYSSPSFWLLALALCSPSLISTGLVIHQTSIFEESGLSATLAAAVFVVLSISSAISSLVSGYVADRVGPMVLLFFSMTTLLATMGLAVIINSTFTAVLYVAVMGISMGSSIIVHGTIWAHHYGRRNLGRVQGPSMTLILCASAIGPLPFALFHQLTGTYDMGILVLMSLPVLSLIVLFLARPGRARASE